MIARTVIAPDLPHRIGVPGIALQGCVVASAALSLLYGFCTCNAICSFQGAERTAHSVPSLITENMHIFHPPIQYQSSFSRHIFSSAIAFRLAEEIDFATF